MFEKYIRINEISKPAAVGSALILIAAVAIYNWFISPHKNYILAAQRYQDISEQMDTKAASLLSQVQLKEDRLARFADSMKSAEREFFTVPAANEFLSSLQAITQGSGCRVDKLDFSPAAAVAVKSSALDIKEYRFDMTVFGGYENIILMLERLNKRDQKVWLDRVFFRLADMSSGLLECQVSAGIYTIAYKENNDVSNKK